MGNRESSNLTLPRSDTSVDGSVTGRHDGTGSGRYNNWSHTADDMPRPQNNSLNRQVTLTSTVSSESEVEIPVFDDSGSSTVTVLQEVREGSTSDILDRNTPVQTYNKTPTPSTYAVYIDQDDQILSLPDNQHDQTTSVFLPVNTEISGVTRSISVISSHSTTSDLPPHVLSPLAYQRLRNCLLNLPLEDGQEIKEEAVARVASHVEIQEFEAERDVLMKGDSAKGIFIIIDGSVNVLSESGTDILATLQEGSYFGEISVLFDCSCTARVQTVTKCQFAVLDVDVARRLLHKLDIDIIDYFVTRRYLPTSDHMDVARIQRRMVLTCLKKLPTFDKWSTAAIKELIMQIQPALVILYQENTVIVYEQDPPVALYVVIRGRALIKKDDDIILELDADKDPAVIGEEGMHLGYNNSVTVQTSTCCQIVMIREECLENVLNKFPSDANDIWKDRRLKWKSQINRDGILYQTFPHLLQFEVLYHFIKNHPIFSWCSTKCVHDIAFQGVPYHFFSRDIVCTTGEYEDNMVIVVLKGELELLTYPEMRYAYTINKGDVFCRCNWMEDEGKIIAKCECVVLKITNNEIAEVLDQNKDSQLVLPAEPL